MRARVRRRGARDILTLRADRGTIAGWMEGGRGLGLPEPAAAAGTDWRNEFQLAQMHR